jgi:hypothetical protein
MLMNTNADVVGAAAPEGSTNDKARGQAGQVEEQSKELNRYSRARSLVHQASQLMTETTRDQGGNVATLAGVSGGNSSTRETRCISITRALRRIGHALIARDDGMRIVRAGASG